MATVYRENKERSKRQYVSTAAFNTQFYTYVVRQNPGTYVTEGVLEANVVGATSVTCPAGRILRETGRRLFPGANPGVSTLMVMVFDNVSQLNGFIDPNASMFALFNSDKPYEVVDGTDAGAAAVHRGPSVYTFGNVTAGAAVTAGTGVIATTGGVTLNGSGKITISPVPALTATPQVGGSSIIGSVNLDGASPSLAVVNTTGLTADSKIFLTATGGTAMALTISAQSATQFTIKSSVNTSTALVNWLIIN
jgi:hypothetical protein